MTESLKQFTMEQVTENNYIIHIQAELRFYNSLEEKMLVKNSIMLNITLRK
jgi:hypothetical protein